MSDEEQAITRKTCNRCGATWFPRTPGRPVGCAKCHSPYWDKPRVYKLRTQAGRTDQEAPPPPPASGRVGEVLQAYRRMRAERRAQGG